MLNKGKYIDNHQIVSTVNQINIHSMYQIKIFTLNKGQSNAKKSFVYFNLFKIFI